VSETQTTTWSVARIDEIETAGQNGTWIPIRRSFDVRAFGINAWTANDDGTIISEHDETGNEHQELYVVLNGHAAFTVAGEEIDAPAGTVVFVRDPGTKRGAVSKEDGTTILAVGAKPGEVFAPSSWETNAEIFPLFAQGEFAEAKRRLEEALVAYPEAAGLIYNLACAESRLGETDAAIEHLNRSIELSDSFREYAQGDSDFDPIRDDPRFPSA
jgi:tetratricopeptide (TPR) repeat protein